MFNRSLLKSVQSAITKAPDKRILSLSFENKTYFVKRRMGVVVANGADTDEARERAKLAAGKVRPVRG